MSWEAWTEEVLFPAQGDDVTDVVGHLRSLGLGYDPDADTIVVIKSPAQRIIATGSLSGRVVKHFGVSAEWQGAGVAMRVFDRLCRIARERRFDNLFVFTTPGSSRLLEYLGFRKVEETNEAVLLEFVIHGDLGKRHAIGIQEYLAGLVRTVGNDGATGCIVMNANPFTLGHLHLVKTAASQCERVCVFVVSEDRSAFPTAVRLNLVRSGVREIENVRVIEGGDYIISQATFPLYFLRRPERAAYVQAELDATVFARRIAPAIGIRARFVGEEPYCQTTLLYNLAMRKVLVSSGIDLRVVPRLNVGGTAVSASRVREALKSDDRATVASLVPRSTLEFLDSPEGERIRQHLKVAGAAH